MQPKLLTEEIFLVGDEESLKNKLLFEELVRQINSLINTDMQRLISLLYRIDVSEPKLKTLLQENKSTDAANIIATMIIERQLQKIRSRRNNRQDPTNFTDAEKW